MTAREGSSYCILCSRKWQINCEICGAKFCGKSHESLHRDGNSSSCYPFKILESEGVGRYLVTSRKILAGEVIFKDVPVGVGPNQETSPICLSCNERADCSFRCSECLYPLCNEKCSKSECHVQLCNVLKQEKNKDETLLFDPSSAHPYAYHAILPLKLIMLKQLDPDMYALMDRLMDHNEFRINDPYWAECQEKVVDRIVDGCGRADIDGGEIHRIIGILETNAYEINSQGKSGFRGLFPLSSLMSHGCKTNVFHQWSSVHPYTNTCVAAVDIDEGEEIFSTYVNSLHCTTTRRKRLSECWYFDCTCSRCSDPTEFGSNAGSIICQQCFRERNERNFMLCIDPLKYDSNFECSKCKATVTSESVQHLIREYSGKIHDLSTNYMKHKSEFLSLLDEASNLFHPHHEVISDLSVWLVPILCRCVSKLNETLSVSELLLKRDLCKNMLQVLDRVSPGINRRRGKFLYELAETEVTCMLGWPDQEQLSFTLFRQKVCEIISFCKESIRCLSNIGELSMFEETVLKSAAKLQQNAEKMLKTM